MDFHPDANRLRVVQVAVHGFDFEEVVTHGEIGVFSPSDVGRMPLVVSTLQAIDVDHSLGASSETGSLEFEDDERAIGGQ